MTNFEYLMWLLENDEDLVNDINNMDEHYIPELFNCIAEGVEIYYENEDGE
jgi:hypothetical protein